MSKTKLKSFVDQFISLVKGDEEGVLAEKVYRKRQTSLSTHLHNAKGDLLDLEENLTTAKEDLVKARLNNGKAIVNRDSYVSKLVAANNAVIEAEEAISSKVELISFLEAELAL